MTLAGFSWDKVPFQLNGHEIYILKNLARETSDNRVRVHFDVFCPICQQSGTIRGRFPISVENEEFLVGASMFAALSQTVRFKCSHDNDYY